jgi:hypothetical protein
MPEHLSICEFLKQPVIVAFRTAHDLHSLLRELFDSVPQLFASGVVKESFGHHRFGVTAGGCGQRQVSVLANMASVCAP